MRLGFEFLGLLAILVSALMAWWLGISLLQALILDLGLLVFFVFYTFVFSLCSLGYFWACRLSRSGHGKRFAGLTHLKR